jgi:hypothetical protein
MLDAVIERTSGTVFACLWLAMTAPAVAQPASPEPGRIIGQAIAAGVTLAADDFAAAGIYDVDDEADSTFRVHHLGGRHRLEPKGRWEPFVGFRVGQVRLRQELDLGGSGRSPLDFDVRGVAIEGGALVRLGARLGAGWFGKLRGETTYSFIDNQLRYADSELAAILGPAFDGVLFNWEAEALTLEAGLGLGWERTSAHGVKTTLEAELIRLQTDPLSTEDPVQDLTVETGFERLAASFEVPLQAEIRQRPLRLDARLRHTFLDGDLAEPLDSDTFTDLTLSLITLWPESSRLPIGGLGLGFTYTTADAFDGWSVGLSFGQ